MFLILAFLIIFSTSEPKHRKQKQKSVSGTTSNKKAFGARDIGKGTSFVALSLIQKNTKMFTHSKYAFMVIAYMHNDIFFSGYMINTQNHVELLYLSSEKSEKEIKKIIFIVSSRQIKYIEINLTKFKLVT